MEMECKVNKKCRVNKEMECKVSKKCRVSRNADESDSEE